MTLGRKILAVAIALTATPALAQDPVHWSAKPVTKSTQPGATFDVAVTGRADEEWHVYSVTQGPGGPIPTTIAVRPPFTRDGAIRGPQPVTAFDPNFEIQTETYAGTFTLTVPVKTAADARGAGATLRLDVGYQACTKRLCLPPQTVTLAVAIQSGIGDRGSGIGGSRADSTALPLPPLPASPNLPSAASSLGPPSTSPPPSRSPTPDPRSPTPDPRPPATFGAAAESWSAFLWLAITMGALSLLTPCVFPMVPITVSYFTNHAASSRRAAAGSAALYGLGIVLTFTVFGSVLAAVAGASGLNRLAANPWVNLGITALFLVFALNLFGLYELRVPVGVMSRLDGMSRRRGTSSRGAAGTLLMALTFTITSLTCTAAFIGTLLVVAAQGEWQRPIAGLLAYSATFALPFVALAMAPQLVSHLPRSGPWLTRVKVVMGFLEIAAAMKFLSNADLVWSWGIFTRGVVLIAWILTAAALAIYFAWPSTGLRPGRRPGPGRLMASLATIAFAVWLGTGVAGRRLGELEAFLPPSAVHAESGELAWIINDLDAAIARARASKRLVIIDFTGYTCTNCRWMEANMFPRPEIRAALDTFVRARLYTDGQGPVYEQQQRFQQARFRTVALPLYAIVDPDQRTVATFAGLTRDPMEFLRFLSAR